MRKYQAPVRPRSGSACRQFANLAPAPRDLRHRFPFRWRRHRSGVVDMSDSPPAVCLLVHLRLPPPRLKRLAIGRRRVEFPVEHGPRSVTSGVKSELTELELSPREATFQKALDKSMHFFP